METTLYKLTMADGREFKVFCANKKQKERFRKKAYEQEWAIIEPVINGIHTIKQFEDFYKPLPL